MTTQHRVLVVDDEPKVGSSVTKVLQTIDCAVDYKSSVDEALAVIDGKTYDVVVTDLMMPGKGGMDLLNILKARGLDVTVVVITGFATVNTAVEAMRAGAFDFVTKPFTTEEIIVAVTRAINRTHFEETQAAQEGAGAGQAPPPAFTPPPAGSEVYSLREHSWARLDDDGIVTVGAHPMLLKTIGEVANIDLPLEGEELGAGDVCARISTKDLPSCCGVVKKPEAGRTSLVKLWSPIAGTVVAINEDVERDSSILSEAPFGKGWLLRIEAFDFERDKKTLLEEKTA